MQSSHFNRCNGMIAKRPFNRVSTSLIQCWVTRPPKAADDHGSGGFEGLRRICISLQINNFVVKG